jgi:hypothetical protein
MPFDLRQAGGPARIVQPHEVQAFSLWRDARSRQTRESGGYRPPRTEAERAQEMAEIRRETDERMALGWQRTDYSLEYRPELPKLFYGSAAEYRADGDAAAVIKAVHAAVPWDTDAPGRRGWREVQPVTYMRRPVLCFVEGLAMTPIHRYSVHAVRQNLGISEPDRWRALTLVRGFRAELALADHSLVLDAYAYVDQIADDPKYHHLVVGLEFDEPSAPNSRWTEPLTERCVSWTVVEVAAGLAQQAPALVALELIEGGWTYADFDFSYNRDYLQQHPEVFPDKA